MITRPAPVPDAEDSDKAIDQDAISPNEGAFMQVGTDDLASGNIVSHSKVMAEFGRLHEKYAGR